MPRIISTTTGDGITMRTDRLQLLDESDLEEAQVWQQALAFADDRLNQPWGNHARLVQALRTRLDQLQSRLPDDPTLRREHYKPRSTELWYVLEAVRRANLVEKYISDRPWEAVSLACELGELVTELAFKIDWEKKALAGEQLLSAQGSGARQRRKQPQEERVRYVEKLVAEGWTKRQAIQAAAVHFDVSYSTISKDYYSKKRSTSDGLER